MALELFIPGVPGAKARPRFSSVHKRAFTPQKTVKYESYLKAMMAQAMAATPPSPHPIRMTIEFHMSEPKSMRKKDRGRRLPHVKRPDADNLEKAVMDAANGVLFIDDSQVFHTVRIKRYSDTPGISITLEEVLTDD